MATAQALDDDVTATPWSWSSPDPTFGGSPPQLSHGAGGRAAGAGRDERCRD